MATPYSPGAGRVKPRDDRFFGEKFVRNLDEYASAIAGFRIAAASAAMRKILENLQAFEDDVVRGCTFDVHDKADAASIMLIGGVIEALGWGSSMLFSTEYT